MDPNLVRGRQVYYYLFGLANISDPRSKTFLGATVIIANRIDNDTCWKHLLVNWFEIMTKELIVGEHYYSCGVLAGAVPGVATYIFRGHQRLKSDTTPNDNPRLFYVFELTDGGNEGTKCFCNIPHLEQAQRKMLDWLEFVDLVNDMLDDE